MHLDEAKAPREGHAGGFTAFSHYRSASIRLMTLTRRAQSDAGSTRRNVHGSTSTLTFMLSLAPGDSVLVGLTRHTSPHSNIRGRDRVRSICRLPLRMEHFEMMKGYLMPTASMSPPPIAYWFRLLH
jgi:hypothetical protein